MNVFQRRVYPEYDDGYIGDGSFGPPFTQAELHSLSALGTNYVNLSTHGVFTEKPPYVVNPSAVANLDLMISMIEQADMFVVISIRTGPGRNELAITCEEGTPENPSEWPCSAKNNAVFTSVEAQNGWAAMWAYVANRYKDRKYEPQYYTHQSQGAGIPYPGRSAIVSFMAYVDGFRAENGDPPVVANEYGVHRYAPSAATFMNDQIAAFEARGINYAHWDFVPLYPTQQSDNDDFDMMHGPNPNNHAFVENSLLNVVKTYFSRNRARPSNVHFR